MRMKAHMHTGVSTRLGVVQEDSRAAESAVGAASQTVGRLSHTPLDVG